MSNRHDPYKLGYTRATMVITISYLYVNIGKSFKNYLSTDYSLQFENIKLESLVIVY